MGSKDVLEWTYIKVLCSLHLDTSDFYTTRLWLNTYIGLCN